MARAIRLHEIGGPDVLKLEPVEVGEPGPGQARVRHTYIAVNFIDIYFRTGRYPLSLPNGLGSDAVGVVEAVGPGVTDIRVGDRVGYLLGPQGAYANVRILPAEVLIPLPSSISDSTASTIMMKGMTVQYLFRQVFPLSGGETILYHAAAGGVGLIACQWARALGVTMIGTVSTDEKAEIARAHGCAHTIVTSRENIAQRVREITDGKGVPVVYDSVGKDTLQASLEVANVGGRDGDEVVQLYVREAEPTRSSASRELRGFERVHLKAGERAGVRFTLVPDRDFAHYDEARKALAVRPGEYELEAGASSRDLRLRARVRVD